jgi:hypothetical protein
LKKKLPIDLITVNCNKVEEGIKALEYSSKNIEFNNILLFSDKEVSGNFKLIKINEITKIKEYNNFMLKLSKYVTSPFALIIQDDGHIVNPKLWTDEFLNYDYIGAPWPNSRKWNKRWIKYGDEISKKIIKHSQFNQIGNGGFSLRSQKYLEYSAKFNSYDEKLGEDIFLNLYNFDKAKDFGIKFPSLNLAIRFSYETALKGKYLNKENKKKNYDFNKHFGWHGREFKNYEKILDLKNTI